MSASERANESAFLINRFLISLLITVHDFLLAFFSSLLGSDDRENDLFLCDTNTCKFDGECLRIGDSVTCDCQFKVRSSVLHFSNRLMLAKMDPHFLLAICISTG